MTVGGAATLYASDHVYGEIYEHLPKIARWSKVPVNTLRARFDASYLAAVNFVMVDETEIVDPQVMAITDPDDVPSGLLAKLIAPCVVFSEDRHLRKPGLAQED
jgi:PIN domain